MFVVLLFLVYSKGFKFDSQNLSLLWRKGRIYQELEDWKKAMETYEQLKQVKGRGFVLVGVVKWVIRRNFYVTFNFYLFINSLKNNKNFWKLIIY